jgi:hypothetical protein
MKIFQVAKWGVREDYGKEYYLTLFFTERYSFLQVAIDYGEYGNWIECPYFQMSMGYGRLLSVLFSIGRVGFTFDIAGRNWRDEFFYTQPGELKDGL